MSYIIGFVAGVLFMVGVAYLIGGPEAASYRRLEAWRKEQERMEGPLAAY